MPQEQGLKSSELLTPAEAAALIEVVTQRTITKWCRQGLLPARQINQRWYIHKEQFLRIVGLSPPSHK